MLWRIENALSSSKRDQPMQIADKVARVASGGLRCRNSSSPGPLDNVYLFERFLEMVMRGRQFCCFASRSFPNGLCLT